MIDFLSEIEILLLNIKKLLKFQIFIVIFIVFKISQIPGFFRIPGKVATLNKILKRSTKFYNRLVNENTNLHQWLQLRFPHWLTSTWWAPFSVKMVKTIWLFWRQTINTSCTFEAKKTTSGRCTIRHAPPTHLTSPT